MLWLIAHVVVVVVVQASAWLMWFAFLRAHWLLKLVLVPVQFAAITYILMQSTLWVRFAVIPDIKLLAESRPARLVPWTETCSFANAYLLGIERNSPAGIWVSKLDSQHVFLLEGPDCQITRTQDKEKRESGNVEVGFDLFAMGYSWGEQFQSIPRDWYGITNGEVRDESEFEIERTTDTWVLSTAFGQIEWNQLDGADSLHNLVHDKRIGLSWRLSTGQGYYELPIGYVAFSPRIHPSGSLIAFVSSNNVWRDTVPDDVVVLRVSDGSEVFRAHVPALSRPLVRFVGSHFFAFTDFRDGEPSVRLFRIAERQP